MGRAAYIINARLCRRTNLEEDTRIFQIPSVSRLDELVIGSAVQLLPRPRQFENQRRERRSSSDPRDGFGIDQSHLGNSRVAPTSYLGWTGIITGHIWTLPALQGRFF